MKEPERIHFPNRNDFRTWLEQNHDTCDGFWMIFYKKATGKANVSYDEAVEEALCFGWIDSTVKRVDEEKYIQKFTPRRNISNWSEPNKRRVIRLIENGKMTPAGLQKIDIYLKTGKVDWKVTPERKPEARPKSLTVPDYIAKGFAENEPALQNFHKLAPSCQRHFIEWITCAKREETQQKRLKESIELLKENQKLGMK